MTRRIVLAGLAVAAWLVPFSATADHSPPHDTRRNPNCAWDSKRSADYDGDGQPEHFVAGASHNTSFPRQFVTHVWEPLTGEDQLPPFFGGHDGPDNATVVVQGDHRMLGANPAHVEEDDPESDPEQLHNGAIYAHVDYDEVENGRAPRAEWGAGIYEANHLVMTCGATDEPVFAVACLNGMEIGRYNSDEPCPLD